MKILNLAAAILILPLNSLNLGKISLFISGTPAQAQTDPDQLIEQGLRMMQLFQKGVQQHQQGQLGEALETLQQARKISQAIGNRYLEGMILFGIGTVQRDLDQYALALESLDQALAIFKALDFRNPANRYNAGIALKQMGEVYNSLGQYSKALESYQLSLKNAQEFGVKDDQGNSLNSIGRAYTELRQPRKALESFEQALGIFKELGDKANQATILGNMGSAYMSMGQAREALELRQQALALQKETGDRSGEVTSLNNLGVIYGYLGQRSKALEFYQQAFTLIDETAVATSTNSFPSANKSLVLSNIGLAYMTLGQYEKATKALFDSIEIKESLRLGLKDIDKVSIFETQADTYQLLQKALIAHNKVDTALEIAERGRARAFVELLARRFATPSNQPSIKPPNIEKIKQIAKEQNATIVEYSIIEDIFNVQGLEQFRESELFIWVIKPTGEVLFRRADLKPLWQQQNTTLADFVTQSRQELSRVGRGLALMERTDPTKQPKRLQQLHKLLIQPIADLLPTDPNAKVIFMPQGALFLVPFVALQSENGKYLIEEHTILTAPAIQVLDFTHQLRQHVPGVAKEVLIVGNPSMPSVAPKLGEKPEPLAQLPDAEQEAKAIATLLNTKAVIGNQATKRAIVQQMATARIIHLATHGLLDDFLGLGVPGAIALAPDSPNQGGLGEVNGLLTASEILNLKLNAELVVLSACNTGRGRITSDGVIGLSRSFISAGVPSLVVSLWSVPDAPTAELMTEFYRCLQRNPNKAEALRAAMLTTRKKYPSPIDWAAFTLIGEA